MIKEAESAAYTKQLLEDPPEGFGHARPAGPGIPVRARPAGPGVGAERFGTCMYALLAQKWAQSCFSMYTYAL